MRKIVKFAVAGALAAAAIGMTSAPAHADSYDCNGVVDTNCTYCSSGGGNVGYDDYYCRTYPQWYYHRYCSVWVSNQCIVG